MLVNLSNEARRRARSGNPITARELQQYARAWLKSCDAIDTSRPYQCTPRETEEARDLVQAAAIITTLLAHAADVEDGPIPLRPEDKEALEKAISDTEEDFEDWTQHEPPIREDV